MKHQSLFAEIEKNIIGHDAVVRSPYGTFPLLYADWAASGRLYGPIEEKLQNDFGPWIANTHTSSNITGATMTAGYREARAIIKRHVGATDDDALIMTGSGMTGAVTLLQRILGWRVPEQFKSQLKIAPEDRPIVFISELEHHSNHTSWLETIAEVVVVPQADASAFDLDQLSTLLQQYRERRMKVVTITAASNVTGVRLPLPDIARLVHAHGGLCFVDYTCAAPYDAITMRPQDVREKIDALYFSPHKFLGGPGSPGVLVFDKALYHNHVPDKPGGGTVLWTNPWGGKHYYDDIETREDGGTPPFLGTIRAALAIKLKEKMSVAALAVREAEVGAMVFAQLEGVSGVKILASDQKDRLAVFALVIDGVHYNLAVRLLNDRFGIQARGGCACAGTYGHSLFGIQKEQSKVITDQIDAGDLSRKPGFVRLSLHPCMSDAAIAMVTDAIKQIAQRGGQWANDYRYDPTTNEFTHQSGNEAMVGPETFAV